MTKDIEKGYPGQSFDDYLKEQGAYEKTTELAVKRVLAFQLAEAMEKQGISKAEMARRLPRRFNRQCLRNSRLLLPFEGR